MFESSETELTNAAGGIETLAKGVAEIAVRVKALDEARRSEAVQILQLICLIVVAFSLLTAFCSRISRVAIWTGSQGKALWKRLRTHKGKKEYCLIRDAEEGLKRRL